MLDGENEDDENKKATRLASGWNVALSATIRVGDTGIEPVTSSVSGKRATAAPIAHCLSASFVQSIQIAVERWERDSNPCRRLCRPLPRLSATPP